MTEVIFDCTDADRALIGKILDRAHGLKLRDGKPYLEKRDRLNAEMDLLACHANGSPLRLADLLAADDFNFTHDMSGIYRHMDRDTGKLTDCFVPRFYDSKAAKQAEHQAAHERTSLMNATNLE